LLARAIDRGWTHAALADLPDLATEPVFRDLRSDPRFQAVVDRLRAHYAREADETARLGI
jgi:hypothetical protein